MAATQFGMKENLMRKLNEWVRREFFALGIADDINPIEERWFMENDEGDDVFVAFKTIFFRCRRRRRPEGSTKQQQQMRSPE